MDLIQNPKLMKMMESTTLNTRLSFLFIENLLFKEKRCSFDVRLSSLLRVLDLEWKELAIK